MAPKVVPAISRSRTSAASRRRRHGAMASASCCALANQILAGRELLQHHAAGAGQARESAPRSGPVINRSTASTAPWWYRV